MLVVLIVNICCYLLRKESIDSVNELFLVLLIILHVQNFVKILVRGTMTIQQAEHSLLIGVHLVGNCMYGNPILSIVRPK